MTTKLSAAARNAMANALTTTIGASPTLLIFDGTRPTNITDADAGTVLATMTLPATPIGAASAGVISKSGTWEDTAADASGYAKYYRIKQSTTVHYEGLCAQNWAASTAYVVGQQVVRNGLVYRCTTAGTSASSGGPTGTGTGITDGTAVWAYQGVSDLVLDNTNIAAGQAVTVSSWSYTRGNA